MNQDWDPETFQENVIIVLSQSTFIHYFRYAIADPVNLNYCMRAITFFVETDNYLGIIESKQKIPYLLNHQSLLTK